MYSNPLFSICRYLIESISNDKKLTVNRLFFFFAALCASFNIHAQTTLEPTDLSEDWEVWQTTIPVSGDIKVGMMYAFESKKINPAHFYISLPAHNTKTLCVEISSRDGRYEAHLNYDITKFKQGVYKLIIPTKHKKELEAYTNTDISILTAIGESCEDNDKTYVLSSWNKLDDTTQFVDLFLNSERPTSIALKTGDTYENYKCKKINKIHSVAFNCKCSIPVAAITEESEQIFIKQRVRRGRKITFNKYPMTIKVPTIENN